MNRRANLGARPSRRRGGCPMARYDRAPAELHAWIAAAALPWSPTSCLRVWRRVIAAGGTARDARTALDAAEARRLAASARSRARGTI